MYVFLALALSTSCAHAIASAENLELQVAANPIRKVVTMLQVMQKKVEAEGETAEKLYNKFVCYCKSNTGLLEASKSAAETKIPQLTAAIDAAKEKKSQLQDEVAQHKVDVNAAKDAMERATAVRQKESAAYKAYFKEHSLDMDAVNKAVAALVKGMGGSFLQTNAAAVLQKAANNIVDMEEEDRQRVLSFLAGYRSEADSPSGGAIVGILKTMAEELEAEIGKATREENAAAKAYEELIAAKRQELEALEAAVRTKSKRIGEISVELVQKQEDLEDTQSGLAEDTKFASKMQATCGTKGEEHQKEAQIRQQELQAIAETIKILNDDDALDLFKKTMPSSASSFLQLQTTVSLMREKAFSFLHMARSTHAGDNHRLDLILLALRGKKVGFDAIISKIDSLLEELEKDQDGDTKKKVYCTARFDRAEDRSKALERSISDLKNKIGSEIESVTATKEDLAVLGKHINELDKDVADATEQRKEEHKAFIELMSDNTAAKELLQFATQRLQKFYGAALTQTSMQDTFDAAPELASYKKKNVESRGVMSMLHTLIADIEKDMATAKADESDAQADYEAMMRDSREKRALDSKTFMTKEATRADLKSALQDNTDEKKSTVKEQMAHAQKIASLHKACDWLLKNFDARRAARSSEIENLKNAKLVLAGA